MAWDKELIAEGVLAPDLNDEIRANWAALEAALTKEMYFSTGGTASLQGILKQGGARVFFQDTAPATRIDGSAFAATDNGSLWIDTNSTIDNQFNFLSEYSGPTWTPISTEIIAFLVAQINTWALAQTFSVSPVFTKGAVANNSYLQGRNATDDGNIDIIKVGTNNLPTLPDSAEMASSAAPVEDEAIVNRKFVIDQLSAAVPDDDAFGLWASKSNDTIYEAASDGFVCAIRTSINGTMTGYTDSTSNPSAMRLREETGSAYVSRSFTMPVRKDQFWKVTGANIIQWIPIGA